MATGVYGGGCVENHTVYIFDRGGKNRVAQLIDVSTVAWSRDHDGVSEATIRIEGSACSAQAEILAAIEPKRSEVVIFRGQDRVWEGPVWRVTWRSNFVEVNAHDVMAYVFETPLSQAYDNRFRAKYNANGDLVQQITSPTETLTRINTILQYELQRWEALSPPANILPHLVIHHSAGETRTTAYTKPFEMTVGDHMASLAHYGGIDFACVGRAIHVWDVSNPLGRTRTLTEADFFSDVIITAYGSEMTASVYVVADDGRYGHAEEVNPYYGPWTKIFTAPNEEGSDEGPSQAELNSQAARNLNGRIPVPVEVRVPDNSGIRLDDTLTIHDLVPGVQVPLVATLNARQLSQMQRIVHMQVSETANSETVQVTLTGATTPDEPEL